MTEERKKEEKMTISLVQVAFQLHVLTAAGTDCSVSLSNRSAPGSAAPVGGRCQHCCLQGLGFGVGGLVGCFLVT